MAELVDELKAIRTKAKKPDTLLLLAMKSVIKNRELFVGGPKNPFNSLREYNLKKKITRIFS